MKERVVVTGLGIVSSIGLGIDIFRQNLRNGVNGGAPVTLFDSTGFDHDNICEVKGFEASEWLHRQNPETLGRSSQFAVAAARMALEDAGINPDDLSGQPLVSVFGTTDGESLPFEKLGEQLHLSTDDTFDPELLALIPAQNIALAVSREFELTGEATTLSTACAAGNYAIGTGFDLISEGDADMVICGGSDSACRKTFAGFHRLGTMASECCQPFDLNREGILTGEGSAALILESLSSARSRGATIYAELLGYAMTCDADHMVSPNRDSIAACMRKAHQHAGIKAAEVDYICMHGTGTRANDITETGAAKDVFGAAMPPVSSIKSMLGHSMGAASAFGAAACCLAITDQFLPPTTNLKTLDPECDVDVVPNQAREASPVTVQNDSFAFGGNNAIVILRKYEEQSKETA